MNELIMEGIKLMLLGMGVVFSFLVLLVFSLTGMSRIARHFETTDQQQVAIKQIPGGSGDPDHDEALPAVIGAAVAMYRRSTD